MAPRKKRRFGTLFKKGGYWFFRYQPVIGGPRICKKAGPTKEIAELFANRIEQEIFRARALGLDPEAKPTGLTERIRVSALLGLYLQSIRPPRESPKTVRDKAYRCERWSSLLGTKAVSEISERDMRLAMDRLYAAGCGATSICHYLSVLSAAFTFAVQRGYARSNPVVEIRRPRRPKRHWPFVDIEKQRELVERVGPRLRPFVLLALESGLRQQEILEARFEHIDLERRVMIVPDEHAKNGEFRLVPIMEATAQELWPIVENRRPTDRISPWKCFPYKVWNRGRARAGLRSLRFHDLRHLFGENQARAGTPISDLQELMGHRSIEMTLKYLGHASENPIDAARRRYEEYQRRVQVDGKRIWAQSGRPREDGLGEERSVAR